MWDILNNNSFTTTTTTTTTTNNNFWSPAHDLSTLLNWSSTATPDASSTSSSSSSSSSTPSSSDAVATAVMATVLSLLCVLGVSGNVYTLLVLRLLSRRRGGSSRHRASGCRGGGAASSSGTAAGSVYCFVLNLALADLAYLSTVPFVVCTNVARTWFFGDAGCRLLFGVDLVTMHAIIFLLTAMSAERYAAVARPLRHYAGGRCAASSRRGWAVALFVWVLSLAAAAPNMVMVNLGELRLRGGGVARICVPSWSPGAFRCYITVLFVTSVVAPGLIIGCLYVRLAVKYWRSQTATAVASTRSPRAKVLYMILAIVVVFWACFLPFWAWQLANLYFRDRLGISRKAVSYINHAVTCLTYGNSCVNPFLYTLLTKKYKEYLARRRTPRGAAGAGRALGGSRGSTSSHDAPCRNVRISSRRSTMTSA